MSNTNNPFGFKWLGPKSGGGTYSLIPRKIAANYGTALYRGDLVTYVSNTATGYIAQAAAGQGVKNAYNVGIFFGVEYLSTAQGRRIFAEYWPTSDHPTTANGGDGDALIIPLIGAGGPSLFAVQTNATYLGFSAIGSNVDIYVGTGSVTSGHAVSSMVIDGATLATGQTSTGGTGLNYPFKVYDLYSNYAPAGTNGTDNTSAYNIIVVEPNPNIVATGGLY